jgi:hypothetical protein
LTAAKRLQAHRVLEAEGVAPRLSDAQQAASIGKTLSPQQRMQLHREQQAKRV